MFTIAVHKQEFEDLLANTTEERNAKNEIKCKKLTGK